jgi:hypothetical protein
LSRSHFSDYDQVTTGRCERALLTLLGDIGPWSERIYLAGGLAPRYLTDTLAEGVPGHVGTTDVDIIIGLAVADEAPETYRTLQNNLEKASFRQQEPSFRWAREVDGVTVLIEFLCETDQVQSGRIFRPKGEYTGSRLGAFNVRGAQLARHDYLERQLRGERLDNGGQSTVTLRVANILPYAVLKIFSFQDRHANKDAYDLIFTLLNQDAGPRAAGAAAAASPVAGHPQVSEALSLLGEDSPASPRTGQQPTPPSWRAPATRTRTPGSVVKQSRPYGRSWPASTKTTR